MKLAAHQPNLFPNFGYYVKMAIVDVFVILKEVQFSRDGYQNYQTIFNKKWTVPHIHGLIPIKDKAYVNGQNLLEVNLNLIQGIAGILGISSNKIKYDFPTEKKSTDRLVEICNHYGCNVYVANESAPQKCLDLSILGDAGIRFEPLKMDAVMLKNPFELFNDMGIEKTQDLLRAYVIKSNK